MDLQYYPLDKEQVSLGFFAKIRYVQSRHVITEYLASTLQKNGVIGLSMVLCRQFPNAKSLNGVVMQVVNFVTY